MILVILCIVQIVPDTSVKAETAENTGDITEIHTAAELVKASENQTGSYRLMADIDMTGIDWTPWDFSGKLIVIDEGRIAACGNHDKLLKTCAIYARISSLQSGITQ